MKNKVPWQHWLAKNRKIYLFLCLVFLGSCTTDSLPLPPKEGKREFRTSDPSRLYFKNLRVNNYELEELAQLRMRLYRLRNCVQIDQGPAIIPLIVDNWLQDEAYLLLELKDWPENADTFRLIDSKATPIGKEILFVTKDRLAQYAFAQQIASHLKKGNSLELKTKGRYVKLFTSDNELKCFLTTINDYNKLTDKE